MVPRGPTPLSAGSSEHKWGLHPREEPSLVLPEPRSVKVRTQTGKENSVALGEGGGQELLQPVTQLLWESGSLWGFKG